MRNHHGNPATYRKDITMEDPKSTGYQTKDNPLQEAYMALRRLEEKPEATTAEVLTQTRLIADTVRQGAIIEHERILQIDDREMVYAACVKAADNTERVFKAWHRQRDAAAEREAALHNTARWSVASAVAVLSLAAMIVVLV